MNGDDDIEPDFLEKLYTAAQEHRAEIALCAYDRFEEETGHILCQEMRSFPELIQFPTEEDILAFINGWIWNKLILVECIGSTRLPDLRVGEDLSFQLALYNKCRWIAYVDEPLIHYRVRATSVISNMPEETVYQFARELVRLKEEAAGPWFRDTIEVVAFIHIGISMPLRVYGNPDIDLSQLLRWISAYPLGVFPAVLLSLYTLSMRNSDLTIGDFWGVERAAREFNDEKGVSLIIVQSEKGEKLIEWVSDRLSLAERGRDECIQERLKEPAKEPKHREAFWRIYQSRKIAGLLENYGQRGAVERFLRKVVLPIVYL